MSSHASVEDKWLPLIRGEAFDTSRRRL